MIDNPLRDSSHPADILGDIACVLEYLIQAPGPERRQEWRLSARAMSGQSLILDWLRLASSHAAIEIREPRYPESALSGR